MEKHSFDPAGYQEILQLLLPCSSPASDRDGRASRKRTTRPRPPVRAYWLIGRLLARAGTPARAALQALAQQLAQDTGLSYPPRKLRLMRRFYCAFPDEQSLRPELPWSHYCLLLTVKQPAARAYYAAEAAAAHWSIRELARQLGAAYYERQPRRGQLAQEPIVLEFLGLRQADGLSERALEDALLRKLQDFLLELGRGFAFVARQKRLALPEGKPAYIDLVFYHFLLKCFVLIDLKAAPLTQRDICQMDRYIRLYDDKWRQPSDQPSLGIILCPEKDPALVQYSILAENPQLSVATYQLYLPTPEELTRWSGLPVQPAKSVTGMKKLLF